jgi:hypothetical protein
MDQELAALSSAAAMTLVTLMTTDAWEHAMSAFARLLRRSHPAGGEAAGSDLEAELDAARGGILAARQAGDQETRLQVLADWRDRLYRLAAEDAVQRDELRGLLEQFRSMTGEAGQATQVVMRARASGSGRINQAGRDQTVISG